jgi:hypothetical protein
METNETQVSKDTTNHLAGWRDGFRLQHTRRPPEITAMLGCEVVYVHTNGLACLAVVHEAAVLDPAAIQAGRLLLKPHVAYEPYVTADYAWPPRPGCWYRKEDPAACYESAFG